MTLGTARPSIFDADLPVLNYDVTDTPQEIYPQFCAAQRVAPIALGPVGPEVLSYELARTVLGDPHFGIPPGIHLTAHGVTSGELWDRVVRSILCMEGAEHRRLRGLVSRAFTPRATARMDETIHAVINELTDAVVAEGSCEFVEAIARPYPIPVICALLGAPRQDWQRFSKWAEDIFKIVSFDCNLAEEEPKVLKAWDAFDEYIDGMIADRRKTLTDDLLSELIRAEDRGDRLDAGEVRMLAFSILVAGTDTTRTQLAASMQVLCEHPQQWALLRENPELGMNAVEETMRHSPSMCSTLRSAIEDVTIGDYTSQPAHSSSSTPMPPIGTHPFTTTPRVSISLATIRRPSSPLAAERTTALARTLPGGSSLKHSRSLPAGCRTCGAPKPRRGDRFSG